VTEPRVVFLVGAMRSGTTWLQQLLGAHPQIATPQETDLFDRYVASWLRSWRAQLPGHGAEPERRQRGLPAVLSEAQFEDLLRQAVVSVYRTALQLKPGATVVLDKNPNHTYHVEDAARLLPDLSVLHLVRDGRDAACSMMRAARRDWGRGWAPGDVDGAAELWRELVETARAGRAHAERYVEVRYEQLRSDEAPRVLQELFAFCGAEPDERIALDALARFDAARLRELPAGERPSTIVWGGEVARLFAGPPPEPAGFMGLGQVGGWRAELGAYQRWLFNRVAGDLLVELGYEPDHDWARLGTGGNALARARWLAGRASGRARRLVRT
jgi:Sulfotransferase family